METSVASSVASESSSTSGLPFPLDRWPAIAVTVLATQAVLSLLFAEGPRLTAYNNILYFLTLLLGTAVAARNAVRGNQSIRLFWSFLAAGMGLWAINPLSWVYSVLVLGQDYPDTAIYSFPLFLHIVLQLAAAAARPHLKTPTERPYRTSLNFLILLFFWVFLYVFLMLPFLRAPLGILEIRFETLYFAENLSLVALLGVLAVRTREPWKTIYRHLLGASTLYALASLAVNIVLARRGYTPGLLDIPYTAAGCWFVWAGLKAWKLAPELAQTVQLEVGDERYASIPASLAVAGIPLIGVLELFRTGEPSGTRTIRLIIVLISVLVLAAAVSIQNHLVNRHLASDAGLAQYLLRLAMQAGKAVVWDVDFKAGRTNWSGDLAAVFGIPGQTISGTAEDLFRYVHPEDRRQVEEAVEDARAHGKPYTAEFRVARRDGVVRYVSASGKFYYAAGGAPLRMVGMAVDITDRKTAEEALRKSEEKFSKAFRESPLAFTLTSLKDQKYIEVNETFERLTGWSRDEVIGRTPFDLGLWPDPRQRHELLDRLVAEGCLRNLELTLRMRNGEVRSGLASAELIEINGEECVLSVVADVTEARRAEEARQVSERRFSEFFATLPEYCYITSPSGEILDANPAACEALGYTRDEMRGKPLSALYAPESQPKRAELFEEWKQMGAIHNEEMIVLTKHGERRTVLLNAGAVKDAQGNLLHSASVQVDITERMQIQERLKESQNRLKGIVDSAMDGIIAVDDQQRIIVFNAAAEKMFGCSAQEAIGTSLDRFLPARFLGEHGQHIRRFGETGTTSRAMGTLGALWALRADGSEFPIEASISQSDAGGKKLFTVIVRDVTERSRAEAAIRESEERFRLVANSAPVMIWMSGPDKLCTYFNQPWLDFTGRAVEAEMGNGWAEGVYLEDLQRCLDTYIGAFDRREPFEMEYRLRRHDGEYRWIHDYGVPRFNADGSFAGYIGSCHDVTLRKKAEEALSSVSRRLIEAHEEERTWIARELHDDINQRVAMLAVTLEQVKQILSSSPVQARRRVEEAHEQVSHLGSEIQALSRRLHSSKLEYLGLAAAAAGFCRELSERQKVKIDFHSGDIPQNLPPEIALCLFRVLQEALQNAAKHSRSSHFQVSLNGAPGEIQMTVRDSGIGFNPAEAMNGGGLGLTSMRERLKLVHGELTIESQSRLGTVVRATVPLLAIAKAAQTTG
jgi:PAS domain S-box-containing protein